MFTCRNGTLRWCNIYRVVGSTHVEVYWTLMLHLIQCLEVKTPEGPMTLLDTMCVLQLSIMSA